MMLALGGRGAGALSIPLPYSIPAWEVSVLGSACEPLPGIPVERTWRFEDEPVHVDLRVTGPTGHARFEPVALWRSPLARLSRFASRFQLLEG